MGVVRIKDTGKVNGDDISPTYTQIDSGNWISFYGTQLSFTLDTTFNDKVSSLTDPNAQHLITYKSNEIGALKAPRITLRGVLETSDKQSLTNLTLLQRSKGIKQISGGAGFISALPEKKTDTYEYVNVIIKNLNVEEVVRNGTNYLKFTANLELV